SRTASVVRVVWWGLSDRSSFRPCLGGRYPTPPSGAAWGGSGASSAHAPIEARGAAAPVTAPGRPRSVAAPLPQHRRDRQLLALPQHADAHAVAGLALAQRGGHRVEVGDLVVVEADDDVAGLEAGAVGGRALAHAGQADAVVGRREVRDRTEVRAVAGACGGGGRRARAAAQRECRAPVRG